MSSDSLPGVAAGQAGEKTFIQFDDNALLPLLYGEHDQNLLRIEQTPPGRPTTARIVTPEGSWDETAQGWKARSAAFSRFSCSERMKGRGWLRGSSGSSGAGLEDWT